MRHVIVTSGDGVVRHVVPDAGIEIGRGEQAGLFLAEPKASRRHARISPQAGGDWLLEDLGSANGTWVGDTRISRRVIADGTSFRIGDTVLVAGEVMPEALTVGAPETPCACRRLWQVVRTTTRCGGRGSPPGERTRLRCTRLRCTMQGLRGAAAHRARRRAARTTHTG